MTAKAIFGPLYMILWLALLYSIPLFSVAIIFIVIGWRRAGWLKREIPLLYMPLLTWYLLAMVNFGPTKSLSNLIEIGICAVVASLMPLVRILIKAETEQQKMKISWYSAAFASTVAAAVYFLMPTLPE